MGKSEYRFLESAKTCHNPIGMCKTQAVNIFSKELNSASTSLSILNFNSLAKVSVNGMTECRVSYKILNSLNAIMI
ncbi:MAG: hypothetical protein AB1782_02765 [Cyanobacteriota bacterium]